MVDDRPQADRILVAQMTGEARHRAKWRELTEDETAAAVTELQALAGGRADLLAQVAGLFEGTSEGELDEPLARCAARLCRLAGADPEAIPAWIEEGRRRRTRADLPPFSGGVAELFNLGYEVLLQVLTRFFTHTDETDEQLDVLVQAALGIMAGVLKPLGTALTRLPMGPANPGRTAGPAFQMYHQMGNFVPWRDAAWVLLAERAAVLSQQCADCATRAGVPEAVGSAATTAGAISDQLAGHLPQDLRPA